MDQKDFQNAARLRESLCALQMAVELLACEDAARAVELLDIIERAAERSIRALDGLLQPIELSGQDFISPP